MVNIKNRLHKELSKVNKECAVSRNSLRTLLTDNEQHAMKGLRNIENLKIKERLRTHYKNRTAWIKRQNKKREDEGIPNDADGIVFEEQDLGDAFSTMVRMYGGVQLTEEELDTLKLPPRYAMYEKPDEMMFSESIEKTFNKIRWNKTFEEREQDKQVVENDLGTFFSEESKTFDGKNGKNVASFNSVHSGISRRGNGSKTDDMQI